MACVNIDPGSIATMSLASRGLGAVGGLMRGISSAGADKYNATVAEQNAQIARQNATWAGQAGEAQVAGQEQKTRATVGAIKATQAASNIDVNSGSAPDVRTSAETIGQLDALSIRSNAARAAYGEEVQATGFENQAQLDKSKATGDILAGATTFLGDAGSGTANWANFMRLRTMAPPAPSA